MSGPPPENSPRRCHARRRNGERCRRWALRGRDYCQFHGGRRGPVRTDRLPMFYSRQLNRTLQEAVESQLEMAPREQLALFEELALMRLTAQRTVSMWNAAVETGKPETEQMAVALMVEALKNVEHMCTAAARVESTAADKVSIHTLKAFVSQIVRIAYETMGEEHVELARKFEKLVREEIKLPSEEEGTTLTPDADVTRMDDTVPNASA